MPRRQQIQEFLRYLEKRYAPSEMLHQETTTFLFSLENETEYPAKEFQYLSHMIEFAYKSNQEEQGFFKEESRLEMLLRNEENPEKQQQYQQELERVVFQSKKHREKCLAIVKAFEERKEQKIVH